MKEIVMTDASEKIRKAEETLHLVLVEEIRKAEATLRLARKCGFSLVERRKERRIEKLKKLLNGTPKN